MAGIWSRSGFVLTVRDRPAMLVPFRVGPVRAVAELAIDGGEAELGLSVEPGPRRRGIGNALVQAAGGLLTLRGVERLCARTLPDNRSFIGLARSCGACIEAMSGEMEAVFDVATLRRAYLPRAAIVRRRAA